MRVAGSERPLPTGPFDAIVVGGGISGVAIARECARAGKRTLVLEQDDFGSGTTSRSTRIIHGGLRYLEHGEIGLVRESLRERERLLRERPHLVRPMNFMLALPRSSHSLLRSALAVRTGLWLYKGFATDTGRPAPARFEQVLDEGGSWTLFHYEDAQCEFPERMVAEWLQEAMDAGATARNYTEVLQVTIANGLARGVIARDRLSGREFAIEAPTVVNASGPWVDSLRQTSGIDGKRLVGGVRGSHIVLPRFAGAPESAIYTEASDRRAVFIIPWNGQTLVGSTEVGDSGDPAQARPSQSEIGYLFETFQRLFPASGLTASDIVFSFAGVRALPFSPGAKASGITRKHFIHHHADEGACGMYSIVGGKLTTAASLARACARELGISVKEPAAFRVAPPSTNDIEDALRHLSNHLVRASDGRLSVAATRAIAEWHGRNSVSIARLSKMEGLSERLCSHTEHIVAEAVYAVQEECAVTLGDLLLRRVPVTLSASWNHDCTYQAATKIGQALSWDDHTISNQMAAFEEERSRFLVKPYAATAELTPQHVR